MYSVENEQNIEPISPYTYVTLFTIALMLICAKILMYFV